MTLVNRFDTSLLRVIQKLPEWAHPFMSAVTFIGEPIITVALAFFAAAIAWRQHQQRMAAAFAATILFSGLNGLLKQLLHRTRPNTLYVEHMRFKSYSFPSGHAFGSLVVYGLFAYLALRYLPAPWSGIVASLLLLLIVAIGISRVYLGAHFPSDVIGGWLLASLCLLIIIRFIVHAG